MWEGECANVEVVRDRREVVRRVGKNSVGGVVCDFYDLYAIHKSEDAVSTTRGVIYWSDLFFVHHIKSVT